MLGICWRPNFALSLCECTLGGAASAECVGLQASESWTLRATAHRDAERMRMGLAYDRVLVVCAVEVRGWRRLLAKGEAAAELWGS